MNRLPGEQDGSIASSFILCQMIAGWIFFSFKLGHTLEDDGSCDIKDYHPS